MLRPVKRQSLIAQTAAILKEHAASASAGERLPSERELCGELGVSRMTLRAALDRLAENRLIGIDKRKRRIIAAKRGRHQVATRNVVILSPLPLHGVDARILFWIDELREALAREDYKLDFIQQQNCYSEHPERALEELIARQQPAAWLLYLSTSVMQKWFSARGLPAVIPGSRYPEVRLPSVDVDYRATCRHAVGQFLARGHRTIVLLNPRSIAGGDLESELGFLDASGRAETLVAHHDGTVTGICARIDQLLERKTPPTAFLVSRPAHALTAVGHLVQRGLRLPNDVALIARDHDSFLEHAVPSIARYHSDPVLMAHKICRVVLEIASGGDARARNYRVIPKLISGKTLG